MIAACINHAWQSTLFAIAAGLVALLLRRNGARVRYWVWLAASVKFLVPFAFLAALGGPLERAPIARRVTTAIPAQSLAVAEISRPFPDVAPQALAAGHSAVWSSDAIVIVWALGFAAVVLMRLRGWLRLRAAVRASVATGGADGCEIRTLPEELPMEPGVVGLFRPMLLLPAGIEQRLTRAELDSVMAHEMSHVRSRDPLTAAIHMAVEALFWFDPAVWWISARLVRERERACDEEVLASGMDRQTYASSILAVCAGYSTPPLPSVSAVAGADLKQRVRAIVAGEVPARLGWAKKATLAAAGIAAIAAPVVTGVLSASAAPAVAAVTPVTAAPVIQSAAAAPAAQGADYVQGIGNVVPTSVKVTPRIDGQLMSVSFKEGDTVQAGQVLAMIDPRPYELQLQQAESQVEHDEAELEPLQAATRNMRASDINIDVKSRIEQVQAQMKADEAKAENAKLMLSYAQVTAPITGIAGFRQVDPGNIVHAGDGTALVVITQIQPISVVFTIPEDRIPEVAARFRSGAPTVVEAWNRDSSRLIATGRLTAMDNQIDVQTGTLNLKASFSNKDGALFPNQFVNVKLFLSGR